MSVLWNILIIASAVIGLMYDKLMISDKLYALKYYIPSLCAQLDCLHIDWINAKSLYEYSEIELGEIFGKHLKELSSLSDKYMDGFSWRVHKRAAKRASEITKMWADKLC